MKNIYLLSTLILISYSSYSQIPDYFEGNPIWHHTFHTYQEWNTDPNYQPHTNYKITYLSGVKTFNGNTYHKVLERGYVRYSSQPGAPNYYWKDSTERYVRQEGRAIYIWDRHKGEDVLLFDYDLEVGDTVEYYVEWQMESDTVKRIDSLMIDHTYRRRIFLDGSYGVELIEGLGFIESKGISGTMFTKNVEHTYLDEFELFHCFGKDGVSLYGGRSCDLYLNTEDLEKEKVKIISDYQNQLIRIEWNETAIPIQTEIQLFDLSGKIVYTSFMPENEIMVDNLNSGIYVITIRTAGENLITEKVLIP